VLPIVQSGTTKKTSIESVLTSVQPSGTANGVTYLNGSKVLTSGSALTFDGSNVLSFGVGGSTNSGTALFLNATDNAANGSSIIGKRNGSNAWFIGDTAAALGSGTGLINFVYGNNPFIWYNQGVAAEQMRLTSTGLGIGTSSPARKIHGFVATGPVARFQTNGSNAATEYVPGATDGSGSIFNWLIGAQYNLGNAFEITPSTAAGGLTFSSPAFVVQSGGNVGIGTSSPATKLDVNGGCVVSGSISGFTGGEVRLGTSAANSQNAISTVSTGTPEMFFDHRGTSTGVWIWRSGASERARIDSNGNLLVGTTSRGNVNSLSFDLDVETGTFYVSHPSTSASGLAYAAFGYNGTTIGSITQAGTTGVLYNITSDQRLKENIQDAAPASALIDALKVREYDWKSDGTHQRYGFVAQELLTVAPEAVHQPADPEEMMAVDYSKLVPMLVKEIQSLRARVAQLESK
jgi:hypothetical protein